MTTGATHRQCPADDAGVAKSDPPPKPPATQPEETVDSSHAGVPRTGEAAPAWPRASPGSRVTPTTSAWRPGPTCV